MTHDKDCLCSNHLTLQEKRATSDYWRTAPGIARRIEMLSGYLTHKVVNNSLMFYGYSAGITHTRWVTRQDERVCIICGPLDGRTYRKGQFLPPLPAHANCLTPETLIQTSTGLKPIIDIELGEYVLTHKGRYREVIQLHRNQYEGKIYGLGEGWLTGNHPVLTPEGWVTIDRLENGNQVRCISPNGHRNLSTSNLNDNETPPSITKKHFLSRIMHPLRLALMPVSAVDFDGNLQTRKSKVDVVCTNSILRNNLYSRLIENLKKLGFKWRHRTLSLTTDGAFNAFLLRRFSSLRGFMSGTNLFTSLFRCSLSPLKFLSVALIPNIHIGFHQSAANNAPRHSEVFRDGVLGHPFGGVHFDDFINRQLHIDEDAVFVSDVWHKPITSTTIDNDTYKGYVYNLSISEDESYTIGKDRIVVHNCRCSWELINIPTRTP